MILDAPENGHVSYQKGDFYCFTLFALNGGEKLLQQILNDLYRLPNNVKIRDEKMPFRNNLIFHEADDLLTGEPIQSVAELSLYSYEALQQETDIWIQHDQCWLNWISPARLLLPKSVRRHKKNENHFCRHRSQLDFANLNNRLYDTLAELLRQRVDRLPSRRTDETQRLEMADVFWMDYSYYNNQGNEKPMGGLLGRLLLDTEDMPLEQWCYWILGQYVGIGQRRSFGWGRYQLESIETGRTIPRASAKTSLLALACEQENLETAYLEIGEEEAEVERLIHLREQLLQDEYTIPTLHKQILKEDSRLLQVPPFFDRVAQRAVAQVLTPALDTLMYSGSFGFRRGRSRHSAAQMIQRTYQAGYRWVFESDIDDFFDNIQWSRLYTRLTAFFGDDAVVDLVMGWMSATVEGKERKAGLPQGSPLSPLLANIMLDDFDSDLETAGLQLVRFADDFVVLTHTQKEAEAIKDIVIASLAEVGLQINVAKTRVRSFAEGFRFLGYLFVNGLVIDIAQEKTINVVSEPKSQMPATQSEIIPVIYVVCYDVNDDRVHNQIAQVLLKYGNQVQFSVFEVMLRSQDELKVLLEKLRKVADEQTNIRLYRLCENCRKMSCNLDQEEIAKMPAVIII
ncbi:CRISPR-associated endonuclease Cas2 [Candidatus Marithioploca araucensis]|uniref:CRISPR-associated endoribonuclease Cas2 n=1 Tax=Candidatus Marithioploca araucensis TaxID=70273 RepID=A0ABT7VQU8_9GAMM|nr:CRISPR-associated endonuclease Cas2 [Candidatus Marithioploca araucensis]